MKIIWNDYTSMAFYGLDGISREYNLQREITAIGCHRGMRRSPLGVSILSDAHFPIANKFGIRPTINYADFSNSNFSISSDGLSIPNKTEMPFKNILLFHDGGKVELDHLNNLVIPILQKKAGSILTTLLLQECFDQESILAIA